MQALGTGCVNLAFALIFPNITALITVNGSCFCDVALKFDFSFFHWGFKLSRSIFAKVPLSVVLFITRKLTGVEIFR